MKTTIKILFFSLTIALISCSEDLDEIEGFNNKQTITNEHDIVIADGEIQSPQWLVEVIDSIEQKKQVAPWIYQIEYESEKYINVTDWTNSCWSCGELLFTLEGEQITPIINDAQNRPYESSESFDFYNSIMNTKNYQEDLIWWKHGQENAITTKVWGTAAAIHTPNGSLVSDTYYRSEDLSTSQKAFILQETLSEFVNAEYVDEATTTYNCHAYAWSVSEGGEKVWMGRVSNPTYVYWQDGSYISTSSGSATKVAYLGDGNHSAITTGTPDIYISKWGLGPLLRHHKTHCPYYEEASSLIFLKKNDIPAYYIGTNAQDYSGSITLSVSNGNAGTSLFAYNYNSTTPSRYEWSAEFYGSCDRWYIWPSTSRADISVYLNSNHSGGSLRVTCEMYDNNNTLLGSATYYVYVYPQSNNLQINAEERATQIENVVLRPLSKDM